MLSSWENVGTDKSISNMTKGRCGPLLGDNDLPLGHLSLPTSLTNSVDVGITSDASSLSGSAVYNKQLMSQAKHSEGPFQKSKDTLDFSPISQSDSSINLQSSVSSCAPLGQFKKQLPNACGGRNPETDSKSKKSSTASAKVSIQFRPSYESMANSVQFFDSRNENGSQEDMDTAWRQMKSRAQHSVGSKLFDIQGGPFQHGNNPGEHIGSSDGEEIPTKPDLIQHGRHAIFGTAASKKLDSIVQSKYAPVCEGQDSSVGLQVASFGAKPSSKLLGPTSVRSPTEEDRLGNTLAHPNEKLPFNIAKLNKCYSIENLRLLTQQRTHARSPPVTVEPIHRRYIESLLEVQLPLIYRAKGSLKDADEQKITLFGNNNLTANAESITRRKQSVAGPLFQEETPKDFREQILKAAERFLFRKEQVTRSGRRGTITTVTINRLVPCRYGNPTPTTSRQPSYKAL